MTKTITLTDDLLKLISFLNIEECGDDEVCFDRTRLFSLGNHLLEDMAFILGKVDEAIPNTETNENGRAFPDELEKYMLEMKDYIAENLTFILSLVLQFASKGGLTVGTYKCKDNELLWERVED